MALHFDSTTHTYTDENGKELISITTLLQKHHIAPSYEGVKDLSKYADRGTLIHEELHNYIINHEIGFTDELGEFIKWVNGNEDDVEFIDSEFSLHNDLIAGTCDFLFNYKGELCRADFKTTSQPHYDYVAWQLSLYDYLDTRKAKHFYLFHFGKEGLKVIEVRPKTLQEITKLLDDEKEGKIYTPTLELSIKEKAEITELTTYIDNLKAIQKTAEVRLNELKQSLLEKMESANIKKLENDLFAITYVAPTSVKKFDDKKLKEEDEETYNKYLTTINKASYVKITIKKGAN